MTKIIFIKKIIFNFFFFFFELKKKILKIKKLHKKVSYKIKTYSTFILKKKMIMIFRSKEDFNSVKKIINYIVFPCKKHNILIVKLVNYSSFGKFVIIYKEFQLSILYVYKSIKKN